MADQAWVTLATNDSYSLGAMVLASSLRRVNTTRQLAVMVTSGVSPPMRAVLESLFNLVVEVNVLDSQDAANLALLTRPELGITFTKLHCWRLVQYSKCVFLDADTLVLQNCDDLFDREEFSAAPDAGWPDCFNSGVFVFKPCLDTYSSLLAFAIETGSFDGGDQGLLNSYFNDWSTSDITRHLPFIYNMVASAVYSYLPAYRIFGQNVRIAHFIGPEKPWLQHFDTETGQVRPPGGQEHLAALLQSWWDIFRGEIHLRLSPEMKGLAGAYAKMSLEGTKTTEQIEYVNEMRKQDWEAGRIDYLGQDSFDNILKKIQASVAQGAAARAKSPSPPKSKAPKPAPALAPETAASPSGVQASDEKVVSAADSPPIESVPATVESASDPGESKAVSVPDIVDSVPSAVESAPVSVDSTPATIELATLPVEVALEPVGPEAPAPLEPAAPAPLEPAAPAAASVEPAAVPVEPAAAPVEPTAAPVEPAQAPVEPTAAPVEPTAAPVEPAQAPAEPAAAPVELAQAPAEPALAPVEPAAVPVEPAAPLVEPASASVEPTSAPVEPASASVEPTSAPVEPTSASVEPTSAPVEPAPVESVLATVESAPALIEYAPVPDSLIATAPIPIPDSTGSITAPASEPPAQAPIPEVVAAVQTPAPESTPAATVKPAPALTSESVPVPEPAATVEPAPALTSEPLPVPEPAATQAPPADYLDSTKPKEPEPAAKTAEELEDARLAQERQAVEKKLSEQKKIAEQKLQEEKAAAVAAAAASAPVPAEAPPVDAPAPGVGATGAAAGPKPPGTASGIPQPKAPPRAKQPSKARTFSQKLGYGIGIGIVAAAIGIGTYYGGGIDTTKLFR